MTLFAIDVITNHDQDSVALKLFDQHDCHLASHEVMLADHQASLWEGLLDTRNLCESLCDGIRH